MPYSKHLFTTKECYICKHIVQPKYLSRSYVFDNICFSFFIFSFLFVCFVCLFVCLFVCFLCCCCLFVCLFLFVCFLLFCFCFCFLFCFVCLFALLFLNIFQWLKPHLLCIKDKRFPFFTSMGHGFTRVPGTCKKTTTP